MGMWLPVNMRPEGTSEYVQGVEVPFDYDGVVPEGFEITSLDAEKIMIFQGPKYDDEVFEQEIMKIIEAIKDYDPRIYGFEWNTSSARMQLEPQGYRGYIEGRPVVEIKKV